MKTVWEVRIIVKDNYAGYSLMLFDSEKKAEDHVKRLDVENDKIFKRIGVKKAMVVERQIF